MQSQGIRDGLSTTTSPENPFLIRLLVAHADRKLIQRDL